MHENNIQNIINIVMHCLTCPVIIQQWQMDLIETMTGECMASLGFLSCYPYKGILRFIIKTLLVLIRSLQGSLVTQSTQKDERRLH